MMIKAKDLLPGQVVRVEYGDYDNWQKFCVERVQLAEKRVRVGVHSLVDCSIKTDLSFLLEESVEVVV